MNFAGSTILVTGGSSGLGAACVHRLVSNGAQVIIADLKPPAEAALLENRDRIMFVSADVTSETDLQRAITQGEQQFGPIRGAVACAGVLHAERVVQSPGETALENFRRVVEVNLIGTYNTVRLAAEAIARCDPDEAAERGVIVLTSSIAAFEGQVGQAAYAASKGGVAALTLPLARELGRYGIRVVTIAPGAFETPMMQAAPEKVQQSLIDQTPFPKRLGQADDFAALLCHAFENRMLNGCVLRLDGALRMGVR